MIDIQFFKKGMVLVALSLFGFSANAQKSNVNRASSALTNENFDKAKEFILLALENAETKTQAQTWYYKGRVYENLLIRSKTLNDTVLGLADETIEAYQKAIALDKDKKADYKNSAAEHLKGMTPILMNKVSEPFNNGDYTLAKEVLLRVVALEPNIQNYTYLASAAYNTQDYELSFSSFEKLVELGHQDEAIYNNLISTGSILKKNVDSLLVYVLQARSKYPKNKLFIYNHINLLENKENPNEDTLVAMYEEILLLDPNDENALFNIGVVYFNRGVLANNAKALKSEVKALYEKALVYLEKAHQLKPSDKQISSVLKKDYVLLGMTEKADALGE